MSGRRMRWPLRVRGLSVGRKLILIYIFGIFVPLVVANGLVLRGALRDAQMQEREFLNDTVANIRDAIAREFEPIELVSDFVYAERPIYLLLNEEYSQFDRFIEAHRDFLVPALTKYANVFPGVSRITIYTENPIVGVSDGYLRLTSSVVEDSEWFARYERVGRDLSVLVHVDQDPRTEIEPTTYISLIRELDATSLPRYGRLVLRIDVNPLVVNRHLRPTAIGGSLALVDPDGGVAAALDGADTDADLVDVALGFDDAGPLAGWTLQGSVSLASHPLDPTARWTRLFVVSGLSIAISSLLIMLLSRNVTRRLRSVSRQMHRVEREDFSPVTVENPGEDEVGQLIADYNLMASKVEALINDGYRAEIERNRLVVARQQAELDALQSQVNPHYLYNVLESVRMKSHIRGEHETATVVKRISRSLRRLTSWNQDMVPIEEEIEFTREYIEIQRYRFGERLQAAITCDPNVTGWLIPKLTIQGLVENACVHGIEPKTDAGTVSVTVAGAEDAVLITITDDGVGCDADRIRRQIETDGGRRRHIGIANISRRLALHFGDRSTFRFDSIPGEGTRVEIAVRGVHEPVTADYG